jgi:hypothetical protein
MDELELRQVNNYKVWFRKENTTYSGINKRVELERMIKILTDEDFIGSEKNKRLKNPDNFIILERYPDNICDNIAEDYEGEIETYTCLCSEDSCSYLMIINHLLTDIKFAVGSRCYLRFDEKKSKEIYHKIQSIKCIECKCPLVYKRNECYNVNTNQKCNDLCYSCDKRYKNLQGLNGIIDDIIYKETKIIKKLVIREINKLKEEEEKLKDKIYTEKILEQQRIYEKEQIERQRIRLEKEEQRQQLQRERELNDKEVKKNIDIKNYQNKFEDNLNKNKISITNEENQIKNNYISKKYNDRIYLNVPYDKKDDAKKLGAWWDSDKKLWYAPNKYLHKLINKYKKNN